MDKFVAIAYGMIVYDTAIVYMDDDKTLTFDQAVELALNDLISVPETQGEFDAEQARRIAYMTKEFEGGIH